VRSTLALTFALSSSACVPLEAAPPEPAVLVPVTAPPTDPRDTNPPDSSALALNGVDAYMSAHVAAPDPFVKEATLSAWVYFSELPSAALRIFHIVGKSGFARDLDLQAEPDDHFHFYVAVGAPNTVVSKTKIVPDTWYWVAATYRAGDRIALYVDGAREAERAIAGVIRRGNLGPITVGENATFNGRHFHGFIRDVALWNRALTAEQIGAIDRAVDCSDPTLVAAYRLDGDARDCSAHHLDGQLGGGAGYAVLGSPGQRVRL
jgi:hypothetical protein